MSASTSATGGPSSAGGENFSRDETLEMLSNRRRRFVMHLLKQRAGETITVSDLAEQVASWENSKPVEALTHQERKRVRNALRQFHLPKMADYGFVEFDSDRGFVRLTQAASDAEFYVDSLTGGDIPWGMYYLGLSVLGVTSMLGLWVGFFPFTLASPLTYGIFFMTALAVSSVGHFYDNYYRMRLGARDKPPEVDEQ